jgi:hypothetical protein
MAKRHFARKSPAAQVAVSQPSKATPPDVPLTEEQIRQISTFALQLTAKQPSKATPPHPCPFRDGVKAPDSADKLALYKKWGLVPHDDRRWYLSPHAHDPKGMHPAAEDTATTTDLREGQIQNLKIFAFNAKRCWDALYDMLSILHLVSEQLWELGEDLSLPDPGDDDVDKFDSPRGLSFLLRGHGTHLLGLCNNFEFADFRFDDFLKSVGQDPSDFSLPQLRGEKLEDPPKQRAA